MSTIENFSQIPPFSDLNQDEFDHVQAITMKRAYQKKEFVFMEGEQKEAVFFIQSGAVKTFKVDKNGNEQIINLLHDGEMFPHIGFFDESPYPATAEVIQDTELLVIPIRDFEELMLKHPQIAVKMLKIMSEKISTLTERIQTFISQDVHYRVVFTLIRLALESGKQKSNKIFITIPITNQDFANMIGSSRETVNRILNQLKKENLIDFDRNGIQINDINQLKTYVDT